MAASAPAARLRTTLERRVGLFRCHKAGTRKFLPPRREFALGGGFFRYQPNGLILPIASSLAFKPTHVYLSHHPESAERFPCPVQRTPFRRCTGWFIAGRLRLRPPRFEVPRAGSEGASPCVADLIALHERNGA